MKNKKDIVTVDPKHIEAGIAKYEGVIDTHLQNLIQCAGLSYTPYLFKDGRVLLVLPNNTAAILYADKDKMFEVLNLVS